jgi:hypothetical protein
MTKQWSSIPFVLVGLIAAQGVFGQVNVERETAAEHQPIGYFDVGLGGFRPDKQSKLSDQHGGGAILAGIGGKISSNLAAEWEVSFYEQSFNGKTHNTVEFLGLTLKYTYPLGRLEPYVGAGGGYYDVSGSDKRLPIGFHALLGGDIRVAERDWIGAQFRGLYLEGKFNPQEMGTVRVGGYFLFVTYRHAFGGR